MQRKRFYYLIQVQYLGYRYSGWQKQPDQKTIELMLLKTFKYVLEGKSCKILGSGRTDAKVSSLDGYFQLFLDDEPLEDLPAFSALLNRNLPPDIRVGNIKEVDRDFNIIHYSKEKEYVYLFSFGEKNHPFCAPYLANIIDPLDIELMKEGALLFKGFHNFKAYTAKPKQNATYDREISASFIQENTLLQANFFPEQSYAFHVKGKGFVRYQVRLMMGALILLGKRELTLQQIKDSLIEGNDFQNKFVAPGSGLMLHNIAFENTPNSNN